MFSDADAYDRFMARWSRRLAGSFVAFCDIRNGDAILDVGCGTGALSFVLCESAKAGRVTGVDPSQAYVSHARTKAHDPRLTFDVGDATRLKFPEAWFDKTLSELVLNFIGEPQRAVQEMIRVTRPSGVVAATVWDYGSGMQMLRVFWDEVIARDATARPLDEAHLPLCTKGALARLWSKEGLVDVRETELTVTLGFAGFDDYWDPFLLKQGPAGAYVDTLSNEGRGALERSLRRRLLQERPDQPFEMSCRAWAVKGIVPRLGG
jgi:SAM-dependent methyltransferase